MRPLDIALRWVSDAWAGQPVRMGSLRLVTGAVDVTRGEGAPTATLTLEPFEALRALTGRRSPDQMRAYQWDGDPEPWMDAFTWGPFVPRVEPLAED